MNKKKAPSRMCVACREMKEKRELARLVRNPDGTVSYDPTGKAPGRGAYICRDRACLERAIKTKAIERALGCALSNEDIEILSEGTGADKS